MFIKVKVNIVNNVFFAKIRLHGTVIIEKGKNIRELKNKLLEALKICLITNNRFKFSYEL